MSLLVPVKQVEKDGRELVLYTSGRKYDLVYESEGQRIHIKSNMEEVGYAKYMFNLFKKDLGLDDHTCKPESENLDGVEDTLRELIRDEIKKIGYKYIIWKLNHGNRYITC